MFVYFVECDTCGCMVPRVPADYLMLQEYVMPGIIYASHTQNRVYIVYVAYSLISSWSAWNPGLQAYMVEEEGNTYFKGPRYFGKRGGCQPPHYWRHGVRSRGVSM